MRCPIRTEGRFFPVPPGTLAAASLAAPALAEGPNETVRAAVLGVNGRGKTHIEGFMGTKGVKVVLLCDPDRKVLDQRAREFEKTYGYRPETETDLRKVFERKDVDVVSVATPNHWHSLATIWACQRARMFTSRSPAATTFTKAGRWSRRPRSTAGSSSTACSSEAPRRSARPSNSFAAA